MIEHSESQELEINTQALNQEELRAPKMPDLDLLIGAQRDAFQKLLDFTESGESMFCFEGFAGVGKSFCINMFIEYMIASGDPAYICACAPTHKAKVVLMQMAEFKDEEHLHYNTIHSLLGLKPIVNEQGDEIFIKDRETKNKVGDYDYIIVDEASMLDDRLFHYLMEELDKHLIKIIFVGDHKQLPPVHHVCSAPMDEKRRKRHNIGHSVLTEIVRQKGTNPIIQLSKEIREGSFRPKTKVIETDSENKALKEGVYVVPHTAGEGKAYKKILKQMFTTGEYEINPNYCRVVAWTNNCVNEFNRRIRNMIYNSKIENYAKELKSKGHKMGEIKEKVVEKFPFYQSGKLNLPKYVVGDKLIADKPIFHPECKKTIIFQTNEEMIITDIEVDSRVGLGEVYQCYIATVKNLYTGKVETIEMIHETSEMDFERHLDRFRKAALAAKAKDKRKAVEQWKLFYALEKRFARLKYAPCLTTYKSQGSTYENIIIIAPDIKKNPKERERLQHLYVGVTRATKRAFIFT